MCEEIKTCQFPKCTDVVSHWLRTCDDHDSDLLRYSGLFRRDISPLIHKFSDWVTYPSSDFKLPYLRSTNPIRIVLSDDGRELFTAVDNSIIQWNLVSVPKVIRKWSAHMDRINCMDFHSGVLLTGSEDRSVTIWDAVNTLSHPRTLAILPSFEQSVHHLKVTKDDDGLGFITIMRDGRTQMWTLDDSSGMIVMIRQLRYPQGWTPMCSWIIHYDESRIIGGFESCKICIWNANDGHIDHTISNVMISSKPRRIKAMSMDHTGSFLSLITQDTSIILSFPDSNMIRRWVIRAQCSVFSPSDPSLIIFGCDNGTISIYRLTSDKRIANFKAHNSSIPVSNLIFTADGYRLISCAKDNIVRVWDIITKHL